MTSGRLRLWMTLGAAALLLVAGAAVLHLVDRALQLRDGLQDAAAAADRVMPAVESGDLATTTAAVEQMDAAAVRGLPAGDPLWTVAEAVPGIGANLRAARQAAESLARLGDDVVLPIARIAGRIDAASPEQALQTLRAAASEARSADDVRAAVAAEVATIDRGPLIAPVAHGVDALQTAVDRLTPLTTALAKGATLVPAALGADGPRTILVMVQNTAELRTGGGITGTFVQLDADRGAVTLAAVSDSAQFAPAAAPLVALHPGEERALGDGIGRYVQNTAETSDFDLSARLASAWWVARTGVQPDVVVSVDPVVLSALLGVLGPVETSGGTLDAAGVVDALLVQPYLLLDPEAQNARFADVASAVFSALSSRAAPVPVALALRGPVAEGRVSVWSRHADEAAALADTPLAGPLARQQQAGPGAFAAYLNDATGGKLTPYLDVAFAVAVGVCRDDGRAEVEVTVRLGSTLPADAADVLPVSVTGGGLWGATSGDIAPTVSVVAPPGWYVGGVRLDGAEVAAVATEDAGRRSLTRRTDLPPGESRILSFTFIAPDAAPVQPSLLHTPLLAPVAVDVHALTCGGA